MFNKLDFVELIEIICEEKIVRPFIIFLGLVHSGFILEFIIIWQPVRWLSGRSNLAVKIYNINELFYGNTEYLTSSYKVPHEFLTFQKFDPYIPVLFIHTELSL